MGIVVESLVLTKQFAKAKRYMDVYERESGYLVVIEILAFVTILISMQRGCII